MKMSHKSGVQYPKWEGDCKLCNIKSDFKITPSLPPVLLKYAKWVKDLVPITDMSRCHFGMTGIKMVSDLLVTELIHDMLATGTASYDL